jgi:hypothetical protein
VFVYARRMGFGFRFLLVHADGEPADPGMFLTAIPSWKPGDTFLAGSELVRFRILDVNTDEVPDGAHGVLIVEGAED